MKKTAQILFFLFLFILASFEDAYAAGCSVSISPSEVLTDSTTGFTVTVNNTGDNPIQFVKIPTNFDSNFTVGDASSSGWDLSLVAGGYGMVGGSISAGNSNDFGINGTVSGIEATINWNLEASENADGSDLFSCNSLSINSVTQLAEVPQPEPTAAPLPVPTISNVSTTVGSVSAVLTWNTDINSSGVVSFGTTSGYGSNKYTSNNTFHSVSITGLSASTTYHYKIESSSEGGSRITTDNTFTTGAAGVNTTITSVVTTTVTTTTTNTVTKTLLDTTPPTIRFKTNFKKIYEQSPLVEIASTDGTGVARIEYSVDGGENYFPVSMETIGSKSVTSEFTPNAFEDGDYSLLVRVTDTTGNKVLSKKVQFTIDRLPPRVGPLTIMAGPLMINTNSSDITDLLVGVEYKFIVSSAGGPNKISMTCNDSIFDFSKNIETGVWTSKIKFSKSQKCDPIFNAIDGAENEQEVVGHQLSVNSLGQLINGTVTVYWYDDFEKKFVVWDAMPYGQINPIVTNESGGYSFLLPKGKYYLEARAVGKRTSVSNIITTSETVMVNDDWDLQDMWKFWQPKQEKILNLNKVGDNIWRDTNFTLPSLTLENLNTINIRGKFSVVGLLSSWSVGTNDYLKELDILNLQKINTYSILIQESKSSANSLKRRGGYENTIYADVDGEILLESDIAGMPTTWIVDRFGKVVKTKVGEITAESVLEVLNNID